MFRKGPTIRSVGGAPATEQPILFYVVASIHGPSVSHHIYQFYAK